MKRVILAIAVCSVLQAQDVPVRGVVTYLSSGTVYISPGRVGGVRDSMMLYIVSRRDTTAVLKVFALSSKSAACSLLSSLRAPVVGDSVRGLTGAMVDNGSLRSADTLNARQVPAARAGLSRPGSALFGFDVDGRISLQYYGVRFDGGAYDYSQPALVLNVRATSKDVPLTLDIYANFRTLSRNGSSPLSSRATNQSRIYRLALEYQDDANSITVGRILPLYAPATGSIDGISVSRKFGHFMTGLAVGYQPAPDQRGTATNTRKLSLFTRYDNGNGFGLTAAYARTYAESRLDREAVTLGVNLFVSGGLSLYGYSDVDLRKKVLDRYELSPTLSTAIGSATVTLTEFATLGLGIDIARPLYSYSVARFLPDSTLDQSARSGATLSLNLTPLAGVFVSNTYMPRSLSASVGRQYANTTSASWYNILSTGTGMSAHFTISSNDFSSGKGGGFRLQRSFGVIDLAARYERSEYTLARIPGRTASESFGFDLVSFVTRSVSLMGSFDMTRGYGPVMKSLFAEMSWRF